MKLIELITRINFRDKRDKKKIYKDNNLSKKLTHVQTVLPVDIILELKRKTHTTTIEDAIKKAVYFYLENNVEENE